MPGSRTGSLFGKYRLRRLLGAGGFGEVYEAEDTENSRLVALKVMSTICSQDPVFRKRLFREASAAGMLNEPHVVPVHSYGEIDGQLYLDMRLIRGSDLASVLAGAGALEPARAVRVVCQVASALDAAHAAGLVHRDVKPANVLLTDDDVAYLADFGLANAASDTKLTRTGHAIGTLAYMAPERFTHLAQVDHRADVYALACVLFELLTGSQPYPAGDLPALMGAHLSAPIPRPSRYRPQLPVGMDEVVLRGMAKEPAGRYRTAGELAGAAQRALIAPGARHGDTVQADTQAAALPPARSEADPTAVALRRAQPPTIAARGAEVGSRPRNRRLGRRPVVVGGVVAVLIGVVIGGVIAVVGVAHRRPDDHNNATPAAPSVLQPTAQVVVPTEVVDPSNPRQATLPVAGSNGGLAVGRDGAVYVGITNGVMKWLAGSTGPTLMPLVGISTQTPRGIAVDSRNNVYVTVHRAVLMLSATASGYTELPPVPESAYPDAVAVDEQGNVYITDVGFQFRVWKLAAGSNDWAELPFAGLGTPNGIAVDSAGTVYVTDSHYAPETRVPGRVLTLAAGASRQAELPFPNLRNPDAIAVDAAGNVCVTDSDPFPYVLRLTAGSSEPTKLPFTGPVSASAVAVDGKGSVYVFVDRLGESTSVVKLAP